MVRKYVIVVERAGRNYSAYAPDLPGCVAVGDTVDECKASMQGAIGAHVRVMHEEGLTVPEPSSVAGEVEVPV